MTFVDQLEDQRRELEARRLVLEERYKLRLATAQEFGVIHTRRLGRVREAFAKQCSAAERRNQDTIQRVNQSYAFVFDGGARGSASVSQKRLSHHTKRFLSAARRLYPAWHERLLQDKAAELRTLEEESFMTEQRRQLARDRFEQERILQDMVEERRRRLAAMMARERNESILRRAHRERAAGRNAGALLEAVERANGEGRNARREARSSVTNHRHGDRTTVSSKARSYGELLPEVPARYIDISNAHRDAADDVFEYTGGNDYAGGNVAVVRKRDLRSPGLSDESPCKADARIGMTAALSEGLDGDHRPPPSRSNSSYASFMDHNATVLSRTAASESGTQSRRYHSTKHPSLLSHLSCFGKAPERSEVVESRSRPKDAELSPPSEASLSSQRGRRGPFSPSKPSEGFDKEKTAGGQGSSGRRQTIMTQERVLGIHADDKGTCATAEAPLEPSGSEGNRQALRCCRSPCSEPRAKGPDISYHIPLEHERCDSRDFQKLGAVDSSPTRPCLSLPAAARALAALTLQIEKLASTETSAMISSGYRSAMDAEALVYRQGLVFEAAVALSERVDGNALGLEGFDLSALCGAVLNLVAAHATEILPAEALTGVVSVAKVRAKHRHEASPGKIKFFDALVRHVRRLSSQEGVDSSSVVDLFAPCFEMVVAEGGRGGADRLRRKVCAFLQSAAAVGSDCQMSTGVSLPITPIPAVKFAPKATPPASGRGEGGGKKSANSTGEVRTTMASEASAGGRDGYARWTSDPATDFHRRRARQQQQERRLQPDRLSPSRPTLESGAKRSETNRKLPDQSRSRKGETEGIATVINKHNGARSTAETGRRGVAEEYHRRGSRAMTRGSGLILGGGGMVDWKKKQSLDLSVMGVEMGAFPTATAGAACGNEGRQFLPELEVDDSLEGSSVK